jgi:hypothetical protein
MMAVDAEFVEVHELGSHAAEIVPCAGEDVLDFGVGFFRECGAQIVATDTVFRQQRSHLAHDRAGEICCAPAIRMLDRAQQRDGNRADGCVEQLL